MRVPDILSPMCESSQSSSLGCFSHSYSINVCRMYTDTGLPCNRANEVRFSSHQLSKFSANYLPKALTN